MKQKILLCGICVLLLFACKKDKKAPDTKLYPITFKVSGFSQSAVPLDSKTKTNSLGTQATDTVPVQLLYYSLYNSDGLLVSARNVKKGDANFGQFNENVPAGNYKAVFCGGSNNLLAYRTFFTYITRPDIEGGPAYWDDTFFKLIPFTVTNTGINQSVTLSRATARLAIVLKDAIPTGTSKIVVKFQDTSAIGSDGLHHFQAINTTTKTITTADVGTTNYTIVMNTLNNIKPFDVTIDYYGANPSGPLGTKTIKNVVCKTNYITTLSGNLFTQGNAQFVLAIDQDWGAPVNVSF
ncbi:hypothetical protein [Mucilaginibacter sp. SG564]|uniref:hypothetical protein n=1 Tax=unclassified Mucilaginibacter TaxID=2617802 RepID=UPI001553D897|nr:hypothetical protein [Mucilaginibacter sp. SG564]NOW95690.1 hypothetical protein [Mucilaginibacter sp. SG564]